MRTNKLTKRNQTAHQDGKYFSIRGATIVEMTFALPIFLFFVFTFIELARYVYVWGTMYKGAHDALNVAIKLSDLAIDVRGLDLDVAEEAATYQDFLDARNAVLRVATGIPLATALTPSTEVSAATLMEFSAVDVQAHSMLFRPGEKATAVDPVSGDIYHHSHLTICPVGATAETCSACPEAPDSCDNFIINNQDPMKLLLRNNPLVITLHSRFEPILPFPFVDHFSIVVNAMGYLEQGPTGAYPEALTLPGNSSSAASSSSVPASSSSNSVNSSSSSSSSAPPTCAPGTECGGETPESCALLGGVCGEAPACSCGTTCAQIGKSDCDEVACWDDFGGACEHFPYCYCAKGE